VASALIAGVTLVLGGCGGLLGAKSIAQELTTKLGQVSCTIAKAAAEDANYTTATGLAKGAFKGNPADDLSNTARRKLIFSQRLSEIAGATATVAALRPVTPTEKALVAAAAANLTDLHALLTFDQAHSPFDNSGALPDGSGGQLEAAVQEQLRPDEQGPFKTCSKPPDLVRRSAAYNP
jgi:multidrug efflux pump subunit AcrA (membrane-fusion protein)